MKTKIALFIACVAAALALLLWLAGWPGEEEESESEAGIADLLLPVSACDPGITTCALDMPGGGRLTVDFSARPPRALYPFTARITLETAEEVRAARLDLSGAEMDMGVISHELVRDAEGHYQGEIVLPICITGVMRWQADVIVEYDNERVIAPFLFSNGR
ncbi:MAG: hypothetical protein FWG81_03680 [Betaproteobacteria bacterium]|nr:hypothetical protein [Betaproteobacteria bacterium]